MCEARNLNGKKVFNVPDSGFKKENKKVNTEQQGTKEVYLKYMTMKICSHRRLPFIFKSIKI